MATASSSGADLNGGAIKNACKQIRARLMQVAGARLGASPADIRIVDGVARALGGAARLPWDGPRARCLTWQRVQLAAAGAISTEALALGLSTFRGSPFKYSVTQRPRPVEVDELTGAYRTRRVDIVHASGTACLH